LARAADFWLVAVVAALGCQRAPSGSAPRAAEVAAPADAAEAVPVAEPPAFPAKKPRASVDAVIAPGLGALRQPAPLRFATQKASVYEVGPFPLSRTTLRPGPDDDRQLVEVYCVGCHSTSYIAMQPPLPRATWEAEVQKMRSAYGAVIPDAAAARIAAYLASYYGP
jgi:hypothetical protein